MLPLQEGEGRKGDRLIQDGDLVVVYESYKQMKAVTVTKNGEFQNRYGLFMHNDWIGKPFGCKVTGKKGGFVHLLAPSPQLWTLVLTHRTQILYIMDISFVLAYLEVRPGCVVMESGTGSGSLTTALARSAAPTGHIYTFDFHEQRAEAARTTLFCDIEGSIPSELYIDSAAWSRNPMQLPCCTFVLGQPDKVTFIDVLVKSFLAAARKVRTNVRYDQDDTKQVWNVLIMDSPMNISIASMWVCSRKDFERTGLSSFVTVTVRDIQGEGFPEEFANEVDAVFLDLPQPWLAIPSVAKSLRADSPVCSFSPCMEQVQRTCEALTTTEFRDLRTFEVLLRAYEVHEEFFGTDLGVDLGDVEGAVLLSPRSSPPHKRLCAADATRTDSEKDQTVVSAKDNWMKKGPKKGRSRGEQLQGSRRSLVARPEPEAKGHTGYLTFARRAV